MLGVVRLKLNTHFSALPSGTHSQASKQACQAPQKLITSTLCFFFFFFIFPPTILQNLFLNSCWKLNQCPLVSCTLLTVGLYTYTTYLYSNLSTFYFVVAFICMCVQLARTTEKCLQVYFF